MYTLWSTSFWTRYATKSTYLWNMTVTCSFNTITSNPNPIIGTLIIFTIICSSNTMNHCNMDDQIPKKHHNNNLFEYEVIDFLLMTLLMEILFFFQRTVINH
eukprot:969944_1